MISAIHNAEAQQDASNASRAETKPDRNPLNVLKDQGITFPATLTTDVLGNVTGGRSQRAIWESLLKAGIRIDFEKTIGVKGLSMSVNALYPQGSGLTAEAVRDFNTLSNIDEYDSVRLYEAWLQQEFGDGKFSIRLGQILADAEFFSSDYGALFVNSSFGAVPIVSRNLNPPIFPVAAPGLRLRTSPSRSFYAEAAIFSGNVGDPGIDNKHNTQFAFHKADGALIFAEMGYKMNSKENGPATPVTSDDAPEPSDAQTAPKPSALPGSYKLGAYYDSGMFVDSGGGAAHHGDYSVYMVADQELWHPDETGDRAVSFFTRLGVAPADRNTVAVYYDTGFNYKGPIPAREKDTLGIAFSYTRLSADLIDESGRAIRTHYEGVLELTYQAAFGHHVSLQPDFQCIFNPGAVRPAATALAMGLRMSVKF